jgi:hypothetical protein
MTNIIISMNTPINGHSGVNEPFKIQKKLCLIRADVKKKINLHTFHIE